MTSGHRAVLDAIRTLAQDRPDMRVLWDEVNEVLELSGGVLEAELTWLEGNGFIRRESFDVILLVK